MKILRLQAENFKRLRAIDITPNPDEPVVVIGGANGAGKSSALDAIVAVLGGKAAMPAEPLRHGADDGHITLEVGDYVIRRRIWPDKPSDLVVTTRDGAAYKSPQAILDALYGDLTFDPQRFADADPKAQAAMLRQVVPLDIDLDQLDADIAEVFAERTAVGRMAREAAAKVPAEPPPAEPLDDTIEQLRADIAEVQVRVAKMDSAEGEHDRMIERRMAIDERRQYLQAELKRLDEESREVDARVKELSAEFIGRDEIVAGLEVMVHDYERRRNADILRARNMAARDHYAQALETATSYTKRVEALTETLEKMRADRQAAIERAPMPVEGLAFGEDGLVTFRGVPFAQISTAEQTLVSFAIARAMNPKLEVVLIRHGSLLDEASRQVLYEAAREHKYQVWLEVVGDKDATGIIIEDGTVRGAQT